MFSSSGLSAMKVCFFPITSLLRMSLKAPSADFEWISSSLHQIVTAASSDISVSVYVYVTGASPSSSSTNLPTLHGQKKTSSPASPDTTYPSTPIAEKYDEKGSVEDGSAGSKKAWEVWGKDGVASGGVLKKMGGRPDVKTIFEEEVAVARGAVSVDGESFARVGRP